MRQIVPKVWLLFYNEEDLPKITAAAEDTEKTGIYYDPGEQSGNKGYTYRQRTTVNGETVEIFYMDAKNFSRGQSYVFAYETMLPDYTFTDADGATQTGDFSYPKDYYINNKKTVYVRVEHTDIQRDVYQASEAGGVCISGKNFSRRSQRNRYLAGICS